MIIKVENLVCQGPYKYRQSFLNKLWEKSEEQMQQWKEDGITPAYQPGFLEHRLRLRRATALHFYLKKRYPDPVEEMLRSLGSAFMR